MHNWQTFTVCDESLPLDFCLICHTLHYSIMQFILIYFILLHNITQCIPICIILLYNITHYSHLDPDLLNLTHNMTQYSHLSSASFCCTMEKAKLANFCIQNFSLVIQFVFMFWAYNKTIFWEVGVSSIFSTWFLLHNVSFSSLYKTGFLQSHPIGYINGLVLLHSHMTWGIAFVRVFHLHYFNAGTVHLVLCLFQPAYAQIYNTTVSLYTMYTPTCFDICTSSSGSFTFVPC